MSIAKLLRRKPSLRIKTLMRDHDWHPMSQPEPLDGYPQWSQVQVKCSRCGEERAPLVGNGLTLMQTALRVGCARPFNGRYKSGDFVAVPSSLPGHSQVAYFRRYLGNGDLLAAPAGSDLPLALHADKVRPILAELETGT